MKTVLIVSALSFAALVPAQWTAGGYLDGYYQFDFGGPASGDTLNGRGLDTADNRLRFAVGQIDITKTPTEDSPWGLILQLYAGKNADLIHLAEPGGKDKFKFFRQAYLTYPLKGFTIDFGKFDTWIGYEGIDNRYQDQYSRSFNWTYSETTYETGLRITGKLNGKLNGGFYLVQGWNEVEDGNDTPSVGVSLAYAADPKTTITVQNHYGDEGSGTPNDAGSFGGIAFPNAGIGKVHLTDLIVSHQLTPATKIAFNFDYGTASGAANNGSWNGEVLYLKHQISPTQAAALRFDRFEDASGLRAGLPLQLYSLTGTYDRVLNKNLTLRVELRQDLASQSFFNSRNGLSKERTTLTAAAIFRF